MAQNMQLANTMKYYHKEYQNSIHNVQKATHPKPCPIYTNNNLITHKFRINTIYPKFP